MSPLEQSSQQHATDRGKVPHHPAVFRFGQVPPQPDSSVSSGSPALDHALNGGWPIARLIEVLCDRVGIGEMSLLLATLPKLMAEPFTGTSASSSKLRDAAPSSSLNRNDVLRFQQRALWVLPSGAGGSAPQSSPSSSRKIPSCVPRWPFVPYAPAFEAMGIDLKRLAIVQTSHQRETLWAIEQALLSNCVKRVFGWATGGPALDDFALRRLAIAARRSESLCFLMRPLAARHRATPAEMRIAITPASRSEIEITVLKRRGLLHEVSLKIDPRQLACLSPQRSAVAIPARTDTASVRPKPLSDATLAEQSMPHHDVLTAIGTPTSAPPKIRERSFILDR